jgi:hypothetical protein
MWNARRVAHPHDLFFVRVFGGWPQLARVFQTERPWQKYSIRKLPRTYTRVPHVRPAQRGGWLTLESLIHFFFLVRSRVAHDTTVVDHRVVTSGLGVGAAPFGL